MFFLVVVVVVKQLNYGLILLTSKDCKGLQ